MLLILGFALGPSEVGIAIAAGVVWTINEIKKHRENKKDKVDRTKVFGQVDEILTEQKKLRLDMEGQMKALETKVTELRKEFLPNGGSSGFDMWSEIKGLQQAQFHAQLNQVDTPIFLCDKTGNTTFVNKALSEKLGLHYKDALNRGWLKAIGRNQADRERVWTEWIASVNQDLPFVCEYVIVNQRTGQEYACISMAEAQRKKDGEVMFYLGTVTDKK